jgi:hypothetical protein
VIGPLPRRDPSLAIYDPAPDPRGTIGGSDSSSRQPSASRPNDRDMVAVALDGQVASTVYSMTTAGVYAGRVPLLQPARIASAMSSLYANGQAQ